MTFRVLGATLAAEFAVRPPSLTTWSRLEVVPASSDLAPGLQAMIADPLWMLGRQWQFLEFDGDDAGSPVDVRVQVEVAPLERFHPGRLPTGNAAATARDYASLEHPLEVMIEQETVRPAHRRLRVEAGLYFLDCLDAAGVGAVAARYLAHAPYRMDIPAARDSTADPLGQALHELTDGVALDGAALANAFRGVVRKDGTITRLPARPAIPVARKRATMEAAARWLQWYEASLTEAPDGEVGAWEPSHLEYGMAVSATLEAGPVVLIADEYAGGRLDWHAFDAASGPSLGRAQTPRGSTVLRNPAVLPSPVRYPGMPASRFWEFEDRRVNLAQLDASRTDLTRLLLVEFGLAYGDDWFVVPVDLPIGAVTRIRACTVRDTFGEITSVGPSRNRDGSRWSMFELTTRPDAPSYLRDVLFLPPALPRVEQGLPVETVALFRDEMANLVWAVERCVQGVSGDRVDRYQEAEHDPLRQVMPDAPEDVQLIYRLASPVPRHWIPFVPTLDGGDPLTAPVRLERRALLRYTADAEAPELILPRGALLRSTMEGDVATEAPLRIHEAEVLRDGLIVERRFQHTRWIGGRSLLWLGREKRIGDGEGSSGLVFDAAHRARGGPR